MAIPDGVAEIVFTGLNSFGVVTKSTTDPNVVFYDYMDTSKVVHTLKYNEQDPNDYCIHFQKMDHHLYCSKPLLGNVLVYNLNDFPAEPTPIYTIDMLGELTKVP